MKKIPKDEIVKVIAELRDKGYSLEELAVMLGRTQQTLWAYSSLAKPDRVPSKSDYEVLKRLTVK